MTAAKQKVAPARERGLKLGTLKDVAIVLGRSREGAWIEINTTLITISLRLVAPARERGLK